MPFCNLVRGKVSAHCADALFLSIIAEVTQFVTSSKDEALKHTLQNLSLGQIALIRVRFVYFRVRSTAFRQRVKTNVSS